jgi:hypothetical protein
MQNLAEFEVGKPGASRLESLPTEILSDVAIKYLYSQGKITTISHISRRIRQGVLGTASIWAGISILPVCHSFDKSCWFEDVRLFISDFNAFI